MPAPLLPISDRNAWFECPFCGLDVMDDDGEVLHRVPACADFAGMDALDYLAACRADEHARADERAALDRPIPYRLASR